MSLKFKIEINFATFDSLMEENANVVFELSCLASNIKKEFVEVLDSFLSFLRKFEKLKSHNMFFIKLDPKLKTFHLVSSLIGCEQSKTIVEEYDIKSLFPMIFQYYYDHLHSLVEF
jgi:hypothetical protein